MPRAAQVAGGKHRRKHYDRRRGNSAQRGYNRQWRNYRLRFMAEHPMCEGCKLNGRYSPMYVVDHIEPHRGNKELFDDIRNHQGLCVPCHDRKTKLETGQATHDRTSGRHVISGVPGSGKTTWVEARATDDDVVWDMDQEAIRLGMSANYPRPHREYHELIVRRAKVLSHLMLTDSGGCYVIISDDNHAARVARSIGAKHVALMGPPGGRRDCRQPSRR